MKISITIENIMLNKIIAAFILVIFCGSLCFGQDLLNHDDTTRYIEDATQYIENITTYSEDSTSYMKDLTKYIEDFTYYQFGEYIDNVYVVQLQTQDYINSRTHIFIGNEYDLDVSKIFGNLLIGSGVIVITILVIPVLAPTITTNYIAVILSTSAKAAVTQGAISGVVAYIQTGGDTKATLKSALEGASEGFKYGAVVASGVALDSAIKVSTNAGKVALDTTEDLHRPYIRNDVRREIERRAPKTHDGRYIDPNTGQAINGPYDLGHKRGHEFWREKTKAMREGLTQPQFNDRMNNPDLYQIEYPAANRSHRYELPGRN
jgi:hypothetical protein